MRRISRRGDAARARRAAVVELPQDAVKGGHMSRLARSLIAAGAALCLAVPAAAAAPPSHSHQLSSMLGEAWTTVLQLPVPDNPLTGGSPCVYLPDGQLVPLPNGPVGGCTVQRGTKIFVTAATNECSTFPGDCGGPTDSYSQLLATAEGLDAAYTTHTVAVDGNPVAVTEVVTAPLHVVLPANNLFGLAGGTSGLGAAHGWVVLLNALPVGTHMIVIHQAGQGFDNTFTMTINVVSCRPSARG
jgi:hypothetical protein